MSFLSKVQEAKAKLLILGFREFGNTYFKYPNVVVFYEMEDRCLLEYQRLGGYSSLVCKLFLSDYACVFEISKREHIDMEEGMVRFFSALTQIMNLP